MLAPDSDPGASSNIMLRKNTGFRVKPGMTKTPLGVHLSIMAQSPKARIVTFGYISGIFIAVAVIENHLPGFFPMLLIHGAIKGNGLPRCQGMFSMGNQGVYPLCSKFPDQIKETWNPYILVAPVGDMHFQILVKDLQAAAGSKGKNVLNRRIHEGLNLE
jgi:hypothetical protein